MSHCAACMYAHCVCTGTDLAAGGPGSARHGFHCARGPAWPRSCSARLGSKRTGHEQRSEPRQPAAISGRGARVNSGLCSGVAAHAKYVRSGDGIATASRPQGRRRGGGAAAAPSRVGRPRPDIGTARKDARPAAPAPLHPRPVHVQAVQAGGELGQFARRGGTERSAGPEGGRRDGSTAHHSSASPRAEMLPSSPLLKSVHPRSRGRGVEESFRIFSRSRRAERAGREGDSRAGVAVRERKLHTPRHGAGSRGGRGLRRPPLSGGRGVTASALITLPLCFDYALREMQGKRGRGDEGGVNVELRSVARVG